MESQIHSDFLPLILNNSLSVCQPLEILVLSILFRAIPHFYIELFGFLMAGFLSFLYTLEIRHPSDLGLVKTFSHSVDCHFVLLTVSLASRSFSVS